MPQLKQLSCCIQWADTGAPFEENGTVYGDGVVETFIVIPSKPQGFSIRLTSRGFIYEGLVMVVFIDGNYQCNRSRVNLVPPKEDMPAHRTEIDFLLRQREKSQGDGIYLGREWRFDNHNIVDETPEGFQDSHFEDLGTIEVLVLRCRARDRKDAEYEGSSSGEDSDIFTDRDTTEEQIEASTSNIEEPAAEEDTGFGFIGLFDGANDSPDIPSNDGAHDTTSGHWIWHQSRPPFAEHNDRLGRPHFNSQRYISPLARYPPEAPEKRVHFDDVRGRRLQRGSQDRCPSDHYNLDTERPASRVRERRPSYDRHVNATSHYDPQRVLGPRLQDGIDSKENDQTHAHASKSPYQDGPRPFLDDRDDYREPFHNRDTRNARSQGLRKHNRTGLSSEAPYDSQDIPMRQPEQESLRRSSHSFIARPGFEYHPGIGDSIPSLHYPSMPQPYMPTFACLQPQAMPSEHYPIPEPHAGYWTGSHHPALYGHPHMFPATPLAPGYQVPQAVPHFSAQQFTPVRFSGAPHSHQGSNESFDQVAATHGHDSDHQRWNANSNGEGQGTSSWDPNSPNNVPGDFNWNRDNGNGDNTHDDNKHGAEDKNFNDQNGPGWDTNDNNDDATNQDWDNAGNDNSDDTAHWNNNDDPQDNAQNTDGWGQPGDVNNGWGTDAADNSQGEASKISQSNPDQEVDTHRDLYGPHGPYFTTRAVRPGEARPDAEEEQRYDVPRAVAMKTGSTKQVQPGPGYRYYKKRTIPEYVDSLEQPYARFVFKYRTKDQLLDEIGIEVDVEPSGDSEVQELQNLDKQALIEMLMRAKSALGGKVPSPPATPTLSADSNEPSAPVAVDAPKHNFLRYCLPPLRPNLVTSTRKGSQASTAGSGGKSNSSQRRNGSGTTGTKSDGWNWDDKKTSNVKEHDWNAPGSWDGASANSLMDAAGSRGNSQRRSPGTTRSKQGSTSNVARAGKAGKEPPRPPTPPNVPPLKDDAEDNWNLAEHNDSGSVWG